MPPSSSAGEQLLSWTTTDAGSVVGFFANRNRPWLQYLLITVPFAVVIAAATIRRRSHPGCGALAGRPVCRPRYRWPRRHTVACRHHPLCTRHAGQRSGHLDRDRSGRARRSGFLASRAWSPPPSPRSPCWHFRLSWNGSTPRRIRSSGSSVGRWLQETAQNFLPVGSGIGSFDAVYRSVEPLDQLDTTLFQPGSQRLPGNLAGSWLVRWRDSHRVHGLVRPTDLGRLERKSVPRAGPSTSGEHWHRRTATSLGS